MTALIIFTAYSVGVVMAWYILITKYDADKNYRKRLERVCRHFDPLFVIGVRSLKSWLVVAVHIGRKLARRHQ